jgi:hypothetical protein
MFAGAALIVYLILRRSNDKAETEAERLNLLKEDEIKYPESETY